MSAAVVPPALIALFRSVFAGREDVFAVRWEQNGKSGYMPAYQYDPYLYRQHKRGGGTFQNFPDKAYRPLSAVEIEKHLSGQQLIGIYPLLTDNTSWWLAADFDQENWVEDCRIFLKSCLDNGLVAYLERSRSGKGGHVWVFFEKPYPASKSRAIFKRILEQSGVFSIFDKDSSFDRLFPNQDTLSGKGLGNLIALPLYRPTWEQGNSCFIDPNTLQPYEDQWQVLREIQRTPIAQLDTLFAALQTPSGLGTRAVIGRVCISLDCEVRIFKGSLTAPLIDFLKDTFNVPNSEFFVRQSAGRNTWGMERYFNLLAEKGQEITTPRGGIGKIIRFCKEQNIAYDFLDLRHKHNLVPFRFSAILRTDQQPIVEAAIKKDFGIIVAPPGSGKTVIALKIIADKKQPALILVHRKQLIEQWMERITAFLGIPKREIGLIGQGKKQFGAQITIATLQSLSKALANAESQSPKKMFGTIIVDECHHVPAATFRDAISQMDCYYLYGLTATPFRKYSDGQLIFMFLGDVIAEIKPQESNSMKRPKIVVRVTDLEIPFNPKTDLFETLSRVLVHDSGRNRLILEDIKKEMRANRKSVVLTERKEHLTILQQYLKQYGEIVVLSGDDSDSQRATKWKTLQDGQFQLLLTTGQFFGEGIDLPVADCLFLVYPFAFEGKLIQYIGRVQRGEQNPTIYDYHDRKIDYLHRLFLKRNVHYRKIAWQSSLFDDPQDNPLPPTSIKWEATIKVPIEHLEFLHGLIAFEQPWPQTGQTLRFEIENDYIRPEWDVLKPYFIRVLGQKHVTIQVYAEIEKGETLAQTAVSDDLARINREVIDSVKFRFIEKTLLPRKPEATKEKGLLDITQLQSNQSGQVQPYDSGEVLLDELLLKHPYKHSQQLRYLADLHEHNIMKLRFVLSPFSFLFLIAGEAQFHFILETLDTEEATYLWHYPKDRAVLRTALDRVENDLLFIRQQGRQHFLDTSPSDFTRILHDYSEDRKGFLSWKALVEQCLV